MTTNHHTPYPFGGPLTSAAMEAPLGQLDAAIAAVIATGSGFSTTLTAQATAGTSGPFSVASTAGLLPGDPIYIGTGATFESRIVNTVPSGTTFTTTANLTNTYAIGKPVSKSPVEIVDARGGFTTLGGRIGVIESQVYNVRKYGAVGDGVTDDLAAFNAAVAALPTMTVDGVTGQMGTIYVPNGNYKLSNQWIIDVEAVHVELAPGAVIWNAVATTNGQTIGFIGGGPGLGTATTPQRLWASIHGGTVYNTSAAGTDNAIGFARFKNAVCENVRITRAAHKAITAQAGVDRVRFINNSIGTCQNDGITCEITCTDIRIEGNVITSAGDVTAPGTSGGIRVASTSSDVWIARNTVLASTGFGIRASSSTRLRIHDNTLLNCGNNGVSVDGTGGSGVEVVRNTIATGKFGIAISNASGNILVDANSITAGTALANTYDALYFDACTSRPIVRGNRLIGTSHRYAMNCVTMGGVQPISTGNLFLTGGTGAYGGAVPAMAADLLDGFVIQAFNGAGGAGATALHVIQGTAAPASGTWLRGDICWNTTPSAAGVPGWICTTAGTPGTWKAMAVLAA